ncbi:Dipeptidyl aminopeptidase/acylaminoacyl peptidase [Amycolatopsis xylanica]|uniref:Dipeptidyl aminopeptidase/acylaminoacyl peptidase n=1 Tax=Amycolatopsis xylanica TaxID=589385 RepID=A0A1H3GED0_9PSEU|nr:alpha/beta fold hydrolase [Amycolatopsis xylanica]SDY01712.1 Dipeptidyl aminopeptidase/acylaminoacyl peptidase [Amycolatopsis xylanica]
MTLATPSTLWDRLNDLRSRMAARFSATGNTAATVATDGHEYIFIEFWRLSGPDSGCEVLPGYRRTASNADAAHVPFALVPFDTGSVLLLGRTETVFLDTNGVEHVLPPFPVDPNILAPAPDGTERVAFAGRGDDGTPAAWVWTAPDLLVKLDTELPPVLLKGRGWLDPQGNELLINVTEGGRVHPEALDLRDGSIRRLPLNEPSDSDIAWFTSPESGQLLVFSRFGDQHRLRVIDRTGAAAELWSLEGLTGSVRPIAMHPGTGDIAVHVNEGMREQIAVVDVAADTLRVLPNHDDRAVAWASWATGAGQPDRLWGFSIGSGYPGCFVGYDEGGWLEVPDGTTAGAYSGWAPSHLESFPGAEGPIEAIVCGHDDWRTAEHVVLALHGGPASRWTLKFSQLFQFFAEERITVIAPNPRGSTGYDDDFHQLIVGNWAGPDLHDVLAIAEHVRELRPGPLALYGPSYGAYLALLAACAKPGLWSRVAAIAPMLSGERLYEVAAADVRAMIDRLGGKHIVCDELGSRDVLTQLPKLATPLLVVHGSADPTIPASQSRELADRLIAAGKVEGLDFEYVEVPGGGHTPLDGSEELHRKVARFLSGK